VGLEAYDIIILSSTSLLQKRLLPPFPRSVHWEKYFPRNIYRKKQWETEKIRPHLAFILVPKNCPKKKIKKKVIGSRKGEEKR
jgi:hypothetical protein